MSPRQPPPPLPAHAPVLGNVPFQRGEILRSGGGEYIVRGMLGRGGMAQVLDVEDRVLGKRFALKVLDAHLARDPASVERFEREARALAKLDHPNLVAVVRLDHTVGPAPRPFFLMERLRGGTLREHIDRGPMPIDRVLELGDGLFRALDYVHRRQLLHRDVKPSNVFVHRDTYGEERAKLLDFGVMKLMLEKDAQTGFFGTAHYAAPEQLEAGGQLGPATDVYSAGIVLFEMLSGAHPFAQAERSARGARAARVVGPPSLEGCPRLGALAPDVRTELVALVAALLDNRPDRRPTALVAARTLSRLFDTIGAPASHDPSREKARTADPAPFLPGHLAAPTLIEEPRFKPTPESTVSVTDAELVSTGPTPPPIPANARATLALAPPPGLALAAQAAPGPGRPQLAPMGSPRAARTLPLGRSYADLLPEPVLPLSRVVQPAPAAPASEPARPEPPRPSVASPPWGSIGLAAIVAIVAITVAIIAPYGRAATQGRSATHGLSAGASSPALDGSLAPR